MKRIITGLIFSVLLLSKLSAQPIAEDFENSGSWVWSPWILVGTNASTKTTAAAYSGSNGLSAGGEWVYRTDQTWGDAGHKISWWFNLQGSGRAYLGFGATSAGGFCITMASNTSEMLIMNNAGWGYTTLTTVPQTYVTNKWYKTEVTFITTSTITVKLYDTDGITILNSISNFTVSGLAPGGLSLRGFGPAYIDEIRAGNQSASSGPLLPPIANFFPSQPTSTFPPTDTVWLNTPFTLVSTSTNASRVFWDLPGVQNLIPGYSRQSVPWTGQQFIDTAKYGIKFKYQFNRRGIWPVKLLAVNDYKRDSLFDSVVRYIWVDTPSTVPVPNFFAAKRKVGIGDYASLIDISTQGPNQWYWTFSPACNMCTTPPYFNNFFAGPTDQNPLFFGGDPGKFTICLQVWNARGFDTICKKDYIEVINSINICSGSGATESTESEGFMFGPSGPGLSYTRSQVSGCPGFLLKPCADSIYLWVERVKMLPTDTLVIHNGSSSSAPVLYKLGGSSANALPTAIITNGIRGGSMLFVRFQTGTGTIPSPYDSAGFSIRWSIKPASYGKPRSTIVLQDTIFSGQPVTFSNASTGTLMKYSWDSDGNGTYDSTAGTFVRSFLVTAPQYKQICLVTYNCVGYDTICKNVLFLPISQKPIARFEADKLNGFNTDTFRFTDKSLYGPSSWKWSFTPATAQYLLGTTPTSKNPVIRFTQRIKYTVKLVATNVYGSDSVIKVDYIDVGAYDQPQCLTDINVSDGSIGISRAVVVAGIDTAFNPISPCYQLVGGNQSANLYRGNKHPVSVTRPSTSSPADLKAWIDFNMDGNFTSDEVVLGALNSNALTIRDTVRVSATQPTGASRMRVGITYAGTALQPSVLFLGVFRDYVINFPVDTVKPVASLNLNSVHYTEIHKPYVDPGILALDNIEGNISAKYEIIGTVDTSRVGPNYLKYVVRDLYNNVSDTLYRTVFVILNQTGPVLHLDTPLTRYVEVYHKFNEPGYSAVDNVGNSITQNVVVTTNLDTSKLGTYSISYSITDAFGLSDVKYRAVIVGDSTRPVITPIGNPYIHQVNQAIDLSSIVTVTDNYWGRSFIDLTIEGQVDVTSVGKYYITYVARDNSGNISNQIVVEIEVKDTRPPSVFLNDKNSLDWEVKVPFVDPWATAKDNYWPDNTIVITRKGNVDVTKKGDYILWYIAEDPSRNKDSVSRVVHVRDTQKPVVDLLGVITVNLYRWRVYSDPPVAIVDNFDSDAALRGFLVVKNSLPLNKEGLPFGDGIGLFNVTYLVHDSSGNYSDVAMRTINVLPLVGEDELLNLDQFASVYPNPAIGGKFTFRLVNQAQENLVLEVLSMDGKKVYESFPDNKNLSPVEIDLSGSAKGLYVLRLICGDKVYTRKIELN